MMANTSNVPGAPAPNSSLLRKIVVTALTAGVAYLAVSLTDANKIWAPTLAALIGGVVLIVQYLADFDDRLKGVEQRQAERLYAVEEKQAAHTGEVRELVQQSFLKISRATELFGLVEASALRTDAVIQLVQHSTQLGVDVSPLVSRVAQDEIERVSRFLKDLADGTATSYEGEDRDWLLTLAANAKTNIDATSLNTVDARGRGLDSSFWQSDLGQRYLEVQRRSAQQGIRIRRIFIVDRSASAHGPDFLEMCRLQARMGVEVRILNAAELEPPLKTKLLDFILFDNIISYETTPAYRMDKSSPPEIVQTRLQLESKVVEERIDRYRDLWERAAPFVLAG
jgi:hypothetical protein